MKSIIDINNLFNTARFSILTRIAGVIFLLYIALITSWISDDAQITFRQVLNFINGDGIVFNFGERVQAFTHPLWFILLTGIIFVTGELFVTTSILCIIISLLAIIMLLKFEVTQCKSGVSFISPVFFLAFSWAFCDYMTSGLENSLTYFLVALLITLLYQEISSRNTQVIFIILSLLVLNRFDYAILFLPLALTLILKLQNKTEFFKVLWPGVLLLFTWVVFATIYFGSPLPNTFYAKLNAGYPQNEVFVRGIEYFVALQFDIPSIVILAMGFLSLLLYRDRLLLSIFVGKLLYLCYIIYIGGDFMMGRYFSVLVFLSIGEIIIVNSNSPIRSIIFKDSILVILLIIFVILAFLIENPIRSFTDYTRRQPYKGVVDERGVYYPLTGLLSSNRNKWPKLKLFNDNLPEKYRVICGSIGSISLTDTSKYLIDSCGLTDPFLSRIPAMRHSNWRIGHHLRKIPFEYGNYKIGNIPKLPDGNLHELLQDVSLVSQESIFSKQRFKAIWRFFTNSYSNVDFSLYSSPEIWVPLTESFDYLLVEDWEKEIKHDDRPYWLVNNQQFSFNNNLKIESKISKKASLVWLYLNWGYIYDLSINGEKFHTLVTYQPYCKYGVKIYFNSEKEVNSLEFEAVGMSESLHFNFNYLKFLRFRESDESIDFEPSCIIQL